MNPKKTKKCAICGDEFRPQNSLQKVCDYLCAAAYAKEKERKDYDRKTRQMKNDLLNNDKGHWMHKAQTTFNAYIRERDEGRPCISCGTMSGQMQAGHYRSVGAMGSLRFCTINCHRQCATCNNYKSANLTEYRINLKKKIGEKAVDWLERDHPKKNWTIDEYKRIHKKFMRMSKKLKARKLEAEW